MKKWTILITFILVFALSGCLPEANTSDQLSEAEIEALVEQYLEDHVDNYVHEAGEDTVTTTYDLLSFEASVVDMIDNAKTGILGVIAQSSYTSGTGSGVVYKRSGSDYYLITNEHVVVHRDPVNNPYPATTISIVYEKNGLLFEITNEFTELIGYDETTDLAVIRFESNEDFAEIPFGDSYDLQLGQTVFAIGNPLGFEYYGTVTQGIVSGLARYVQDDIFDATLLQHDAAISPGNSGGALLNINGELVGINNLKIVSDNVSNIGFAIPSRTVERIVMDLEDDGEVTRPYLGISTFAQINDCGLDFGVCIVVQEGGAADTAGLEDGDVIVGYKNEDASDFIAINNFNDLREAILNSSVGETIIIEYIRDGVTYESSPTLLDVHPDDQ
jgi:serine protease Do